jgi:hypothetical protein
MACKGKLEGRRGPAIRPCSSVEAPIAAESLQHSRLCPGKPARPQFRFASPASATRYSFAAAFQYTRYSVG